MVQPGTGQSDVQSWLVVPEVVMDLQQVVLLRLCATTDGRVTWVWLGAHVTRPSAGWRCAVRCTHRAQAQWRPHMSMWLARQMMLDACAMNPPEPPTSSPAVDNSDALLVARTVAGDQRGF